MTKQQSAEACILVVEDAPNSLSMIQRKLSSRGFQVLTALSATEGIKALQNSEVDLVITDLKMPKVSGMEVVKHVRENYKDTEVIVITGYPSIDGAIEALKTGAEEYVSKPFTDDELFGAVRKALDKLLARRAANQPGTSPKESSYGITGSAPSILEIFKTIDKAAKVPATVIISGESGTGKELVARAVHYRSDRASAPFVPVNCSAIPESLLESELFGYIKGAFTGATETRAGFFQTADGGTIFLDEISDTSLAMQAKLLRAIQEKEICMVGDAKAHPVDVRIVAATNKDLEKLVEKEQFREDLYYRLNVISICVPPLRERGEDILLLASQFAQRFAEEIDKPVPAFSSAALQVLKQYNWPGNVRELENLVQRLIVMLDDETIDVPDLPRNMRFSVSPESGLDRTLEQVEMEHILNVLSSVNNNKTKAAEVLGITRKTLREKLGKMQRL
ncbi:MAG: sigma-54-dependent transcriptional regulator [Planctomycetota bacterium]